MTIEEAFVELENYIDASDPDLDLVRASKYLYLFIIHFFQPQIYL